METTLFPQARQANALVRAPLKLTHMEARIFALSLACIHSDATELPEIVIPLKRVMIGRGGSAYEQIRDDCKELMSKVVTVETKNAKGKKRADLYHIFKTMAVDEATGMITGQFGEDMKPFLLQLAEQYTQIELQTLLTLRSAHTHRLYWLLTSWDDVGVWEPEIEDLRKQILGDDSEKTYTLFYDFKRYVLEPAFKEFHALGWKVSYTPQKEGKKYTTIRFDITKFPSGKKEDAKTIDITPKKPGNRPPQPQLGLELSDGTPTGEQRVVTRLRKMKVSDAQIRQVLATLGSDEKQLIKLMQVTHPLLRDYEAGNKNFDNLGGATVNLLKSEFPSLFKKME